MLTTTGYQMYSAARTGMRRPQSGSDPIRAILVDHTEALPSYKNVRIWPDLAGFR